MRKINRLVIHCLDVTNGRPTTIRELDTWQAERVMKRELAAREEPAIDRFNSKYPYVAYHFFLPCDGGVYALRGEDEAGSHAPGTNNDSLAAALVGRDAYTEEQWAALRGLVADVRRRYGDEIAIVGHRDWNPGRDCPGFSVSDWLKGEMAPLAGHILRGGHA